MGKHISIYISVLSVCFFFGTDALAQPETKFTKGNFVVERLKGINSNYDEIYPRISDKGEYLYFTRQGHPANSQTTVNGIDLRAAGVEAGFGILDMPAPNADQDVWVGRMVDGQVQQVLHPPWPLNSVTPNTVHCILPGKNQCVIQNAVLDPGGAARKVDFAICNLLPNGLWNGGTSIDIDGFKHLPGWNRVHLYTNGSIGLLSSNQGNGFGSNDLYVIFKKEGSLWSKPLNLGADINTAGMDMSPYLATDLRTLYFTSERNGQADMYVSHRIGDGWTKWTAPQRLPDPINSPGVDRDPCIDPSGQYLYFSSNRNGNFDIYRTKLTDEIKAQPIAVVRLQTINVVSGKPVAASIKVFVQNADASEVSPANAGVKNVPDVLKTDSLTGIAEIRLPIGRAYAFSAGKPGFLSASGVASLERDTGYREMSLTLPLTPERKAIAKKDTLKPNIGPTLPAPALKLNTKKGAVTRISSILFRAGSSQFMESSFPTLDRLVAALLKDTTIRIEVQGHTDNVGDAAQLRILSQKRAEEVKNYLVKKGIDPGRVLAKGYGSSLPVFDNKDPIERAKNRRVEIKVL